MLASRVRLALAFSILFYVATKCCALWFLWACFAVAPSFAFGSFLYLLYPLLMLQWGIPIKVGLLDSFAICRTVHAGVCTLMCVCERRMDGQGKGYFQIGSLPG